MYRRNDITDPRDITNARLVTLGHGEPVTGYDIPEPGVDTWTYGDWMDAQPFVTRETATHILVPYTSYSDYSGSTVEASNHRSLLRDYADTFVDVHGGYDTRALLLPVDWTPPGDGSDGLLDALESLSDYPLYDEEDHSALEDELAQDAWEQYLSYDVNSALDDSDVPDEILDATDGDTLRELFYEITYEQPHGPECEDAVSAYFPFFDDTVAEIARQLNAGLVHGDARDEIPGQDALILA